MTRCGRALPLDLAGWNPAVTAPLRHLETVGSQVFVTLAGLSTDGGNRVVSFNAAIGAKPAVSGSHGVWALWASGGSVIAGGDFQVVAAKVSAGLARLSAV